MEKTAGNVLKTTQSICPTCQERVSADVVSRMDQDGKNRVYLEKHCPKDGDSEALVSSDARFYYLSKGAGDSSCGAGCGCAEPVIGDRIGFLGRNATIQLEPQDPSPFHKLSTCLALIEIVDSCNLACPTCFADSPVGTGDKIQAYELEDIQNRIQGVIDRKGHIEILQLSGGEPTLHPQFFELLKWCHDNPGLDYVLVNSNGVRLAKETEFGERA